MSKCWTGRQDTATKKPNGKTKTNNYFSNFIICTDIQRNFNVLSTPWQNGAFLWLLTYILLSSILSFTVMVANKSNSSIMSIKHVQCARNCGKSFTEPQPPWMYSEFCSKWLTCQRKHIFLKNLHLNLLNSPEFIKQCKNFKIPFSKYISWNTALVAV